MIILPQKIRPNKKCVGFPPPPPPVSSFSERAAPVYSLQIFKRYSNLTLILSILSLILLPSCQQIEQMSFSYMDLGPGTSRLLATGLFTMPNLRTVNLSHMGLDDSLYLVMSKLGQMSQVRTKRLCRMHIYCTTLHHAHRHTHTTHN